MKLPDEKIRFLKNISVFYRQTQAFWAEKLAPFGLGPGHQFFLVQISKHPGLTKAELAQLGGYDNATITKGTTLLANLGYIRIELDSSDKRVHRLYLTEKAQPVLEQVHDFRNEWMQMVSQGIETDDLRAFAGIIEKMALNARESIAEIRQEKGGHA